MCIALINNIPIFSCFIGVLVILLDIDISTNKIPSYIVPPSSSVCVCVVCVCVRVCTWYGYVHEHVIV